MTSVRPPFPRRSVSVCCAHSLSGAPPRTLAAIQDVLRADCRARYQLCGVECLCRAWEAWGSLCKPVLAGWTERVSGPELGLWALDVRPLGCSPGWSLHIASASLHSPSTRTLIAGGTRILRTTRCYCRLTKMSGKRLTGLFATGGPHRGLYLQSGTTGHWSLAGWLASVTASPLGCLTMGR